MGPIISLRRCRRSEFRPYGFSSIKLRAVTAAGPQFGPPGYETNLLYIAALATLVLGGSGPLALDAWLPHIRRLGWVKRL